MKLPLLSLAAMSLALGALAPDLQAAGFDCAKASTQVEKTVCATPTLSAKDEDMTRRYQALKHLQVFRLLQGHWLKNTRNTCPDTDCLESVYRAQVKMLTSLPIPPAPAPDALRPLAPGEAYLVYDPDDWQNFTLATFNSTLPQGDQQIVDAQVIAGVLHVVLFVGRYQQGKPVYVGTLYEYADDQPGLHPIAQDIAFAGWANPGANDQGPRYAGIVDGQFYYREQLAGQLQQSMVYRLGSRSAPASTQQVFQVGSNTFMHARARVEQDLNRDSSQLSLNYERANAGSHSENITEQKQPDAGWAIVNPTWSTTRPVLYFDNQGPRACIWRVDMRGKELSKIVTDHDAMSARPVDIHGREAVVYLQGNQLKFAINPDD